VSLQDQTTLASNDRRAAPVIEVESLHHSYGDVPVLHGIDLAVEPGAIFGFLGHNGAGKTTMRR
jgi:ABC-type multidrug transport system ATPase subunit